MSETEMKPLRWAALQPLTGGMYLGAEKAIGNKAEFIISYPGFNAARKDKDGNVAFAANEYHLCEYLKKKDRMVPYYQFNRTPFQNDNDLNPTIVQVDGEEKPLAFDGLDIVVAVPVCAGLSGATANATAEKKEERNGNMIWLAKFALNTIKPKVYIFENAPRFMSAAGEDVRAELEEIAKAAGYSIGYYKTDTKLHVNCQSRPRTFIYFFRIDDVNRKGCPELGFENLPLAICERLDEIPKDATQQVTLRMGKLQQALLAYIPTWLGDDWRNKMKSGAMIEEVIRCNKLDEWEQFIKEGDFDESMKKQVTKHVAHIKDKMSNGKGFYMCTPVVAQRKGMPSCMFKTMPNVLHYKENRLYTIREWMTVMGFPYDFEMQGDLQKVFQMIGQNVPARTAQFIVSEAVRIVNQWNDIEREATQNVIFFDNTTEKIKPWRIL